MPRKPKTPQKENLTEVSGRDLFQTPNYAVDLLVPFLNNIRRPEMTVVWECAAGLGKINKRLQHWNYRTLATDLAYEGGNKMDFLTGRMSFPFDVIVTNPPFSLKKKFYKKCLSYGKLFALLVPADYSSWIVDAVKYDGAEKIIPNRRIDYITPNILQRIWWGETWSYLLSILPEDDGWEKKEEHMLLYQQSNPVSWGNALDKHKHLYFTSIYDAPAKLLRKYSSSYYHSMWLTWGFGLGKSETYVELTNEMKDNI